LSSSEIEHTEAQQNQGTLYSADGQAIGPITVHSVTHITWRDLKSSGRAPTRACTEEGVIGQQAILLPKLSEKPRKRVASTSRVDTRRIRTRRMNRAIAG
jgi:hypothetical protein